VATIELSACVIEGVSRSRNALINGKLANGLAMTRPDTIAITLDIRMTGTYKCFCMKLGETRGYDWDSGYTCHQLGSGAIVIQLAQPYLLSSMRLLLWDLGKSFSPHFRPL